MTRHATRPHGHRWRWTPPWVAGRHCDHDDDEDFDRTSASAVGRPARPLSHCSESPPHTYNARSLVIRYVS